MPFAFCPKGSHTVDKPLGHPLALTAKLEQETFCGKPGEPDQVDCRSRDQHVISSQKLINQPISLRVWGMPQWLVFSSGKEVRDIYRASAVLLPYSPNNPNKFQNNSKVPATVLSKKGGEKKGESTIFRDEPGPRENISVTSLEFFSAGPPKTNYS